MEELTFSTKKTRREDILELIRSLSPRKTNVPLQRIGPSGDGGYLVPSDLKVIHALFLQELVRSQGSRRNVRQ